MTRWINILILVSAFTISSIWSSCKDAVDSLDRVFWLIAIPLSMSAVLPMFFGAMFGIFARGRILLRPGLDKLLMARNSPLQFIWLCGMIFCAAGIGHFVGCFRYGVPSNGLVIFAGGTGLILGAEFVVRIFPRRFVRAVATSK